MIVIPVRERFRRPGITSRAATTPECSPWS